jgi:y4mF family transcriptional regulator
MNYSVRSPEPRPNHVGAFVRTRRKARGLTQRELAELAEVGTRFVSELERGKATLRLDHVDRVLAVFGKQLGVVDRPRGSEAP